MSPDVLFIADKENCSIKAVSHAGALTGHGLQHANSSREAYQILGNGFDGIEAVIIDLDRGTHGLSILEAITYCKTAPPVIVVAGIRSELVSIARRHGPAACLNKPLDAAELAAVLGKLLEPLETKPHSMSSDVWGHAS